MKEFPIPPKKLILEEQLIDYSRGLTIFLYVTIPSLMLLTIYCTLTGKILSAAIALLLMLGYIYVLIVTKRSTDDLIKRKTYRFVFRIQLAFFGIFLMYAIGINGQFELSPWIYIFFFFAFLIFRPLPGLAISILFLAVAIFLSFTNFSPEARPPDDIVMRFIFTLSNMCLLLYVTLIAFENYMNRLYVAQHELKKSEQKYREQSVKLTKEIEERDRLEAQLHRAIKMETVGKLASGVAHDLNNILSGLVSYPELLLLDLPEDSPLRKPIKTIQKSGLLASSIVQDLLTLARSNVVTTEIIDLRKVINGYLASPEFNNMISYHSNIEIKTNLSSENNHIKGSFAHLTKVVMNLITNAMEAMPSGGPIHVSTEVVHINGQASSLPDIPEGDYTLMTFRDTGVGIAEDDLAHIFEPFYSKKVMGRSGTGLGMAVVWGSVKDHNGHIDISSVVGEGTTVRIFFPSADVTIEDSSSEDSVSDISGSNERILVVDDIREQRELAIDILKRLGYQVDACESGEEGVEYIKKNDVDLVILDMIMSPGIDGLETYLRMHDIKPKQKAIFVSGFSNPTKIKDAQNMGAGSFLRKPYSLVNLGKAVKQELSK